MKEDESAPGSGAAADETGAVETPAEGDSSSRGSTDNRVVLEDVSISVAGRPLIKGVSTTFPAGRVSLVVGPSGAGKSVLLRAVAGLLHQGSGPFEIGGSIRAAGVDMRRRLGPSPVGVVFQNFALFDELSATANVAFGADHRRTKREGNVSAPEQLLDELDVPKQTPVNSMSGGQRQRLAIARTLAYDPPVVLYDEPTSGLDPANARRVATRIRETGEQHQKTTIVVTHDYEHLAPIAENICFLDPTSRTLVELDKDDPRSFERLLTSTRPAETSASPRAFGRRVVSGLLNWMAAALSLATSCVEVAIHAFLAMFPLWRSPKWGLRYLRHYLGLLASPSSLLYFGGAGMIAGFVSTHFVFEFLPHKKYTEPLLTDELLSGLGFAAYRILVPVLLTVLIAARCGAAIASDIGTRVYGHQFDALRSMGVRPSSYLLTGVLHAFLLATPLLVGVGFLAAKFTSLAVFVYSYPEHGADYWDAHYHRDLRVPGATLYWGTGWLLVKILTCGLGVGAASYAIGASPKPSGVAVSQGITRSIIAATLYVLVVHFAFALWEF